MKSNVFIKKPRINVLPEIGTSLIPEDLRKQLGRGLQLPVKIKNSSFDTLDGREKINQSMYNILSTPLGTRLMREDYGSMLPYLVFRPKDESLRSDIEKYTKESLEIWEQRIDVLDLLIDFDREENSVHILINYMIKGTTSTGALNFVLEGDLVSPSMTRASNYMLANNPVFTI